MCFKEPQLLPYDCFKSGLQFLLSGILAVAVAEVSKTSLVSGSSDPFPPPPAWGTCEGPRGSGQNLPGAGTSSPPPPHCLPYTEVSEHLSSLGRGDGRLGGGVQAQSRHQLRTGPPPLLHGHSLPQAPKARLVHCEPSARPGL